MSVFSPVDVRAPNAKRKQLVAKLMQQQAAQAPSAGKLLSVSGRALGAPGGRAGGRPQGIQHNNVLASVLSRLGVGQRGEVDPGFGPHISGADPYSTGHYVAPNEVSGDGGGAIAPGGGSVSAPRNVIGADGQPMQVGGATPPPGSVAYDDYTYPTAGGVAVAGADTGIDAGVIPLGGGLYYNPILDAVHGGTPSGAGSVARGH